MGGCVVKDHNMFVVRVVFLKNVDRLFGMLNDVLIGIVPISPFPSLEQDASHFSAIRRLEEPIICGDEVGHHQ